MAPRGLFRFLAFVLLAVATTSSSKLYSDFYEKSCPLALPTIKRVVEEAVHKERRMGASLLRLHFHDCFVNGCDGSILLDSTPKIDSEKNARPNLNSARGFEVVDNIKSEVEKVCGHKVVSCADILAIAARDSVVALEGPTWEVKLGRRDSTTASKNAANKNIPAPTLNLTALIANFKKHGLNETDLVALSGGHTIGFAQCTTFRNRIYNDTNIDHGFAESLRSKCPRSGGDSNLAPLDPTPARFEAAYFTNLIEKKGLLHSDQALFSRDHSTKELVKEYSSNVKAFSRAFAKSMVKMGNIKPLTGDHGEIRTNCRKVN